MRMVASVALAAALAAPGQAAAQGIEVRNLSRTVARGADVQLQQWLNYDEATCQSSGAASMTVSSPPRLGTLSSRASTVSPRNGPCVGKQLSVMFVHYRAGSTPGRDTFSYTVSGGRQILVNFTVTVR